LAFLKPHVHSVTGQRVPPVAGGSEKTDKTWPAHQARNRTGKATTTVTGGAKLTSTPRGPEMAFAVDKQLHQLSGSTGYVNGLP